MTEKNDEQIKLLREQAELSRELVKWARFTGLQRAKETLNITLNNEKKIQAYHLSDGKNTSTIISKITGINQPKVTELWKEWLALGLGESISASGGSRFKRSFDLKMFGIQVPETKSEQKTLEPQQNQGGDQA